jgi:hypothetical protein
VKREKVSPSRTMNNGLRETASTRGFNGRLRGEIRVSLAISMCRW